MKISPEKTFLREIIISFISLFFCPLRLTFKIASFNFNLNFELEFFFSIRSKLFDEEKLKRRNNPSIFNKRACNISFDY